MKTTKKATLLILAGGLGSRYKGKKQIDPMGPSGECLMEYSIYDAKEAGFSQIVLIINNYFNDETKAYFQQIADKAGIQLDFVYQELDTFLPTHHQDKLEGREKPWGTGHAVLAAKEVIENPFVLINADDYYNKQAYQKAYDLIASGDINEHQYGMVSYPLEATLSDNGTVSRGVCNIDEGQLKAVSEHTKIQKVGDIITCIDPNGDEKVLAKDTLVSMNFWVLHPSVFQVVEEDFNEFLGQLKTPKDEFYIPFVIDDMIHDHGLKVIAEQSTQQWFGVTYPEDKEIVTQSIEGMVKQNLYPNPLW